MRLGDRVPGHTSPFPPTRHISWESSDVWNLHITGLSLVSGITFRVVVNRMSTLPPSDFPGVLSDVRVVLLLNLSFPFLLKSL